MRIVSLLPSATEILFGIGAGDQVVGVTHECDFPDEARSLPQLTSSALPHAARAGDIDRHVRKALHQGSSLYRLDSDLLERLAPNLIITQELCAVCAVSYSIVDRAARKLSSDPRVISLEPSSLEDVYANILTVGEITDHNDGAKTLVSALREREDTVRVKTSGKSRPRTLVLEWSDPPMSGGHWTPGLLETAGGQPILAHPGANSQVIAWEDIASEDPDAIIVAPCGFDLPATQRAVSDLDANPTWRQLRAVRSHHVFAVDGNAFVNRPGPRLIDTIEIFASCLSKVRDVVQTE